MGMIEGPGLVDSQGRSELSYAYPIFWSPFLPIGDVGGTAAGS